MSKKYTADNLDFDGNIYSVTGTGTTRQLYSVRPQGGTFSTQTGAHTGALEIAIGGTGSSIDDMIKFTVSIYNYVTKESTIIHIGGYIYQAIGGATWYSCTATVLANRATQNYTVRFGDNGTNHCVWIGETTTTWSYPQVNVTDIFAGYSAHVGDPYLQPWDINIVTSGQTVSVTLTDNFPLSSGGVDGEFLPLTGGTLTGQLTIDGFSGNHGLSFRSGFSPTNVGMRAKAISTSNRDGLEVLGYNGIDLSVNNGTNVAMRVNYSGDVGIGTTTPNAKLEVKGDIIQSVDYNTVASLDLTTINSQGRFYIKNHQSGGNGTYGEISYSNYYSGTDHWKPLILNPNGGNVGIGTTSPNHKLDVTGKINATGQYYLDSNMVMNIEAGKIHIGDLVSGGSNLPTVISGGEGVETLTVRGSAVGINEGSPTSNLHVNGILEYQNNDGALNAGLTAGAFYRTGDLLKVVH